MASAAVHAVILLVKKHGIDGISAIYTKMNASCFFMGGVSLTLVHPDAPKNYAAIRASGQSGPLAAIRHSLDSFLCNSATPCREQGLK